MTLRPPLFDDRFATLLVFGPFLVAAISEGPRFRGDLQRRAADPSYWWIQVWQLLGLGLALFAAARFTGASLAGGIWVWAALGCAVGISGFSLRAWSIASLGAAFTRNLQVTEAQRVVTTGPYRYLRHPAYTGAILLFAGIGIGLDNALSLAVCSVLPAIGYLQRIPREEALLRRQLGRDYDDYARRTHRLVPGLW
jgi:protein-S-isoprenylcysteine O-methyltransferase Ste14